MNIRTVYGIIISILALATATSCNHKDLCYNHSHTSKIRVLYDWSDAPEANPRGMCVFFYSLDHEGTYYRFDFANTKGGEIELPQGRYELITYNNDTEAVRFSGTNNFSGHLAYTRTGDLLEPMYGNGISSSAKTDNGERVVISPDNLWGCHTTEVSITDNGVKYLSTRAESNPASQPDDGHTIWLYPHDMLCHYSYEVRNVENIEHINRVSASISGMSPSMKVASENLNQEPTTIPLSARADALSSRITGNFLTFGHNPSNKARHKMTFYVVMDDGSKYVVKDTPNLDVTDQVDKAPDRRHVHIIIDNIKLPGPQAGDEGFNPTVDDWGIINEDINI